MSNPYRAMCAELVDALAEWRLGGGPPEDTADADLIARARALLAQPVAEGPTDEELNTFWNCSGIADEHGNHTGNIFEFARAVLAKWGRPTPQPVAVRERLPGPEDCDEQGRCWIFMPDIGIDPSWRLANPLYIPPYHTHWLSANALPTPTQ